ncbi:MAG: NlpC/P60 family protein [Anaerovoracaceae bacterium]|jgi:cell wall-associated NlpC family hydrolase
MKKNLSIGILLILAMIFTLMPMGAAAATKTPAPSSISRYVSNGHLAFKWSPVAGADKYKLTVKNLTEGTSRNYTTTGTKYVLDDTSVLTHACLFTAQVNAQDTTAGLGASSAVMLENAVRFVDPSEIYISNSRLTVNRGHVRTLRITYDTGVLDTCSYSEKVLGSWASSDRKVATVSGSGKVKAIAPGSAVITFKSIDGQQQACRITVPRCDTAAGSVYISSGQKTTWHQVLGTLSQRAGAQNRLNGTVVSDDDMKKIEIYLYDHTGRRVEKYTKWTGARSYDLTKISKNVDFKDVPRGQGRVKIRVTNSRGTAKVYDQRFMVTGKPSYSRRGRKIVEMALTRQGDPYSQWLRGISNYTDCSYLTLWSCKQAANVDLPATAASQYKYIVEKGGGVTASQRRPGDLVFWGGKNNARYKGIWHTAVYMGNNMICHANGTLTTVSTIQPDSRYPVYYGRPY